MADTNRGVLRDTENLRERERERENERREAERDRLRELRREQERESERAKDRELESLRERDRQMRSMAGVPRTYNAVPKSDSIPFLVPLASFHSNCSLLRLL